MKNEHSENDIYHTTSKTENFKSQRVIFMMKFLP